MKIASIVLLLLYSALMFVTLFVKDKNIKLTKLLAAMGIVFAIIHTVLYFVAKTHWSILLISLLLFMAYAITNDILTKKPHIFHWIVRFIISAVIFVLFVV